MTREDIRTSALSPQKNYPTRFKTPLINTLDFGSL